MGEKHSNAASPHVMAAGKWLFNIANDPSEKRNLARSKPEKVRELVAALEAYQAEGAGVVHDLGAVHLNDNKGCISVVDDSLTTGWCSV